MLRRALPLFVATLLGAGFVSPVLAARPSSDGPSSAVAGPAATSVGYARAYRFGPRTQKVVALTFDDGYSPTETRAIFRILQSEHVQATFFPYARAMTEAPSLWRQIAAAGYPIGNHTYSHVNLTRLSTAGVLSELTRARSTIRRITGRTEPAVMRPPYGAYSMATRHAALLAGYPTLALWDVDTRDWSGISASTIVARAIVGTRGSIVLMHAGPANTPAALRRIIANYRARGYRFVTVPALLGIPWT
jgi:peptidoglycan/xylan/chitin deacetylase (PgdA/CDA1 family)